MTTSATGPSPLVSTDRITATAGCSPLDGRIRWAPAKSLWVSAMTIAGIAGGIAFFSWSSVAVFFALSALTLCAGHSVGMHRLLIHRSFRAPIWVEHVLVYLGTLVGMAGPFGMIRAHDMRDWHQRQAACHAHPAHRAPMLVDAFWQMHCELQLAHPPRFEIEPRIAKDRFYRFLERTWMAQQLPPALILFALGGWGWVFWGICLRVAVSLTGHWLVGHLAHRRGPMDWEIEGLPVQGHNVPRVGLITFGECWHNNHHAFPDSALLGTEPGQPDPGFWLVRVLEWLGLASDVKTPESVRRRQGLKRLTPSPASPASPAGAASAR